MRVRVGWGCNARSESRGLGGGEGTINDDAMLRRGYSVSPTRDLEGIRD
jgi:hypothetical protein